MSKEKKFYTILSLALFVGGGFLFWQFIYELSNMIGSIVSATPYQALVQLKRMLPLFLTSFWTIYFAVITHKAYRAKDEADRMHCWSRAGRTSIVWGAVIALYVIIGWIKKDYGAIVEGFISILFPLDIMLAGVGIVFVGYLCGRYIGYLNVNHSTSPYYNYMKKNGKRRHKPVHFFYVISYLHALGGIAATIYAAFILDFMHGSILFNIVLWLNYATAAAMFLVYRYYYIELPEDKQTRAGIKIGALFTVANLILIVLYIVTTTIWNEAPDQNAFGLLPVDFTASFNAFLVLYGLNNVLTPFCGLLYSATHRKD